MSGWRSLARRRKNRVRYSMQKDGVRKDANLSLCFSRWMLFRSENVAQQRKVRIVRAMCYSTRHAELLEKFNLSCFVSGFALCARRPPADSGVHPEQHTLDLAPVPYRV